MRHVRTGSMREFAVLLETSLAQATLMNLKPGQTSGEFGNEHPKSEQWLYVIRGSGTVRYGRNRRTLRAGSLITIPRGETHQIINTAKAGVLRTLNFYLPPAYTRRGEVKGSVK